MATAVVSTSVSAKTAHTTVNPNVAITATARSQ